MKSYLIKNVCIVNEGQQRHEDIFVKNNRIEKIGTAIARKEHCIEIDAQEQYLLPGIIDDQVHFREPGLTHKATIYSEAKAAVSGGVTSFMEMPNTTPPTFTIELLEEKYDIAQRMSLANYSFYIGASNDNIETIKKINSKKKTICGVKIFMGSSTGNLLVDNTTTLESIFSNSEMLIATHCEEEAIIKNNLQQIAHQNRTLQISDHPIIRDERACYTSTLKAIKLAKKHNARLHILHITTANELILFANNVALRDKKITAEVCVHHLHFTSDDYQRLGNQIKCNPAIKAPIHKAALWEALLDDRLDVIATDHAPHTMEEKDTPYIQCPSGLPLVQHALLLMLHYVKQKKISIEKLVQKMCHAPADCFAIENRGYLREGYFADMVLVDMNTTSTVTKNNILYQCGWSPLENCIFQGRVTHTFVNGNLVYCNGVFNEEQKGTRLSFLRN